MSIPTSIPVHSPDNQSGSSLPLPSVFSLPIRDDLIRFAFKNMRLNGRQPYAVSPTAGKRHSAKSWGTGRAMARVARVKGAGTQRAGQGAEANFCRGGHLASPTTVNRKWTRKTSRTIRQLTNLMGIAASSHSSLVEARGHRISNIEHLPIIISDSTDTIKKTKDAYTFFSSIGLKDEMDKVKDSKQTRCGQGKRRNRPYTKKCGALIVYSGKKPDSIKAFRNIEGIEFASLERLSVLDTCPGGQSGRLIIWTESAFKELNNKSTEFEEVMRGEELFYTEEVQAMIEEQDMLEVEKTSHAVAEMIYEEMALME